MKLPFLSILIAAISVLALLLFQPSVSFADEGLPSANMAIAPSVPKQARRMVTHIVSALGQESIGSPVVIPPLDNGDEIILMATDDQNNIILASEYSYSDMGRDKYFTATSTALAITRLLEGSVPPGVTNNQMDTAIQKSPEFTHLVELINSAFLSASIPQNYPGIPLSISTVLGQALKAVIPVTK